MGSASPEVERVGVEAHAERGMVCRRRGRVVATGFVEQVDSLLLHFDQRQYTLLRPSKERLHGSNDFLLERVAQLETALQSRIVIEQAKGILARTLGVSIDQAFSLLRKNARDRGTKLHNLAADIAASPMQAETTLTGTADKRF